MKLLQAKLAKYDAPQKAKAAAGPPGSSPPTSGGSILFPIGSVPFPPPRWEK